MDDGRTCRRGRTTGRRWAGLLCLVLLASGCGEFVPKDQVRMTGACRFQECLCYPNDARYISPGRPEPVTWTAKGDPTCRPGYGLTFATQTTQIFRDQDRITQPDPLRGFRDSGP